MKILESAHLNDGKSDYTIQLDDASAIYKGLSTCLGFDRKSSILISESVVIDSPDSHSHISGQCDFFGHVAFQLELTIEDDTSLDWQATLAEGATFTIPGVEWFSFESFKLDFSITAVDGAAKPKGSFSGKVKERPWIFEGVLENCDSESDELSYLWKSRVEIDEPLSFSGLVPMDELENILAFTKEIGGELTPETSLVALEYGIDPAQGTHQLGFVTTAGCSLFSGISIRNLSLYLHEWLVVDADGTVQKHDFELRGDLFFEASGRVIACSACFEEEDDGFEFDLEVKSKDGSSITLEEISNSLLTFKSKDGSSLLPGDFERKLKECSAKELGLTLNPARGIFAFRFDGTILGVEGSLDLSLYNNSEGEPQLTFELLIDNEPKSIAETLKDVGIPIDTAVAGYLPKNLLSLTRIVFNQPQKYFLLGGQLKQGVVVAGEIPYELNSLFNLRWQNGFGCGITLDAREAPVRLAALEKDFPFSLEAAKAILPELMQEKLGATAFRWLELDIDTPGKSFSIGGGANFLGAFNVDLKLAVSGAADQTAFKLEVEGFDDAISLKKLPEKLGLVEVGATPGWLAQMPDFRLGLKKAVLDTKKGLFSIDGRLGIGECQVETSFKIEKENDGVLLDMGLKGDEDNPPSLVKVIEAIGNIQLPTDLTDLSFSELAFAIHTGTGAFTLKSEGGASIPLVLGKGSCELGLCADLKYDTKTLTGKLGGSLSLADVKFDASMDIGKGDLELALKDGDTLKFRPVAEALFGDNVMNGLPADLVRLLDSLAVKEFKSGVNLAGEGLHLKFGSSATNLSIGSGLLIEAAELKIELKAGGKETLFTINVSGKGAIGEVIQFKDGCKFFFSYTEKDGKTDWELSGDFKAVILTHELEVAAKYQDHHGNRVMALDLKHPFPAIAIKDVGSFEFTEFKLLAEKAEGKDATWDVFAAFDLKTDTKLLDVKNGKVALKGDTKRALILSADSIELLFPAVPADTLPTFTMDKATLELSCDKAGNLALSGSSDFEIKNVPDVLKHVFSVTKGKTEWSVSQEKADFAINLDNAMIRIPAPNQLGDFCLGLGKMTVDLKAGSLAATLQAGLPKNINDLFRLEAGASSLEIFRVYDPDKPVAKDLQKLELEISVKDGFSLNLKSSPFKFFEVTEDKEKKRDVVELKLGDCGELTFILPKFSLGSDGALKASGGFEVKKELSIPMAPLKALLKWAGLEVVAGALTNSIPLKGVKFYDTVNDEFQLESLATLFTSEGASDLLRNAFKDVNKTANQLAKGLPRDLLSYGNIEIPQYLDFDIEITADGGCTGKISVKPPKKSGSESSTAASSEKPTPIRLLIPSFPQLMGIELYSLSFGEMFGGSVLRVDLDVKIDTFDLVGIAAGLLLPYLPGDLTCMLADPHECRNSVCIENLLLLVVYEAAVPIFVPVFYDKLGYSFRGLEGLELESSFAFPKPVLTLDTIGALLTECGNLFQGKDIDIANLKKTKLLEFTVGPNYIRLPKYISTEEKDTCKGKLIGTEKGFFIEPVVLVGGVLNAIKKASVNELIRTVELERRVGGLDLTLFKAIHAHFEYALTTPKEFADAAQKLPNLRTNEKRMAWFKGLTPTIGTKGDPEGVVLALDGGFSVAEVVKFSSGMGLVVSKDGLNIAMELDGKIGDNSSLHLAGSFDYSAADESFLLTGDSSMQLCGVNLFKGAFLLGEKRFCIAAKAGGGQISAEGALAGVITDNEFHLKGATDIQLLGFVAKGDTEIHFLRDAKEPGNNISLLQLAGKVDFANIASFSITLCAGQQGGAGALAMSMDGTISTLFVFALTGKAEIGAQIKAQASGYLKHLGKDLVSAEVTLDNGVLNFDGMLDLWPGSQLLTLNGRVTGTLSGEQFALAGACTLKVCTVVFAEARAAITHERSLFYAKLFDLEACLYLDRDYIHGTMAPLSVGTLLKIRKNRPCSAGIPIDLGGPSFMIATDPNNPLFRIDGEVSLLGITTGANIDIDSAGKFRMDVKSVLLFSSLKTSLTVSGSHLGRLDGVIVAGSIDSPGDQLRSEIQRWLKDTAKQNRQTIDAATKVLTDAVDVCQREVDRCRGEVNRLNDNINAIKNEINNANNWYNSLGWWDKIWQSAGHVANVAAKGITLAAEYALLGVAELLLLAANTALAVARAAIGTGKAIACGISDGVAALSLSIVNATGDFITIERAEFNAEITAICGGSADVTFYGIKLLGQAKGNLELKTFSLTSIEAGAKRLALTLLR